MKGFQLETASGHLVRVSAMLVGLTDIARLLLQHVDDDALDSETRAVFEETSAGKLPSVWG